MSNVFFLELDCIVTHFIKYCRFSIYFCDFEECVTLILDTISISANK